MLAPTSDLTLPLRGVGTPGWAWWSPHPLPLQVLITGSPALQREERGTRKEEVLRLGKHRGAVLQSMPSGHVHIVVLKFLRKTQTVSVRWKEDARSAAKVF